MTSLCARCSCASYGDDVNVKNIGHRHISGVRIRGAGSRRNVRLIHNYAAANCSGFRCALKVVMVVELFVDEDREFQTAGVMILKALD